MIGRADVLLEAEPRERLGNLGLDYADLSASKPELIHVAVTPYGRRDAKSDLPFTDLTLMAASGPPWSCGYDDHSLPPIRGPMQGYHTACHFAVLSVLTALLHRASSGRGQFVDVSMTAAGNVTTESASYSWLVAQRTVERRTGRHASVVPSRETQQLCADGRYVNTGVPLRRPHEFAALDKWLKDLGLDAQLPEAVFLEMGANWEGPFDRPWNKRQSERSERRRLFRGRSVWLGRRRIRRAAQAKRRAGLGALARIGHDDEVTAIFGAGRDALRLLASRLPAQEFFLGCQRAGLAVGVVNSPEEAFEDEHFKARGFHVPVRHKDIGLTAVYPGAPYAVQGSPWSISRRAPKLGEHEVELFGESVDR